MRQHDFDNHHSDDDHFADQDRSGSRERGPGERGPLRHGRLGDGSGHDDTRLSSRHRTQFAGDGETTARRGGVRRGRADEERRRADEEPDASRDSDRLARPGEKPTARKAGSDRTQTGSDPSRADARQMRLGEEASLCRAGSGQAEPDDETGSHWATDNRREFGEDSSPRRASGRRGRFDETDDDSRSRRRLGDRGGRRRGRFDDEPEPSRRGRLTEGERVRLAKVRDDAYSEAPLPGGADRWSTWGDAEHGPLPRPSWVVTELAAADSELGVLKTGKEADVHLLRREVPGTHGVLHAAKRYRSDEHRLFHRDAGYLEGRRMRRSRENRAMAQRSSFGRNLIAEQWAVAEFGALSRLWTLGAPVPYPVQRNGTELLLEFVGEDDGTAAPRLAQVRPEPDELADLWLQATSVLGLLAAEGLAHGDLSAYNLLVHRGRLVVIDLPQIVDVVANPGGVGFLARDVRNLAGWFHSRGLGEHVTRTDELLAELVAAAGAG